MSEASVIYQELGERHNWTVQLYNGAAACAMQLGNWEEAEQYLQVDPTPPVIQKSWLQGPGIWRALSMWLRLSEAQRCLRQL